MDRRSFLMTLVGGFAAAGMGGIAAAEAAQPKLVPVPDAEPNKGEEAVTAEMKEALDKTDAEFSQYYYYRRPRYYARPAIMRVRATTTGRAITPARATTAGAIIDGCGGQAALMRV